MEDMKESKKERNDDVDIPVATTQNVIGAYSPARNNGKQVNDYSPHQ
jgi:hypothetical protein